MHLIFYNQDIKIWNASTGECYDYRNTLSPLRSVGALANAENIWFNLQSHDVPWKVRFDVSKSVMLRCMTHEMRDFCYCSLRLRWVVYRLQGNLIGSRYLLPTLLLFLPFNLTSSSTLKPMRITWRN